MYLYFDYKGTLLETVNDEALRQYNKGVNTINIYIEDVPDSVTGIVPDDGKIPSYIKGIQYWFQLANGDKLQSETYAVETKVRKTIPFDRKRDLRHFKYGKQYEFFSFSIPSGLYERSEVNANTVNFVSEGDVFKSSGLALMTVQALTERINDDDTVSKGAISLERVAFTVEDAVVLPEDIVSTSEFNWLLQEYVFGDYLRAQLVYTKVDVINSDHAFTVDGEKYSIDLEFGLFNRDPKADDVFLYIYTNASGTNIALATVDEVRGQVVSCSFLRSNSVSIKGEKGDKGNTGMTPNITASASVDSSIGTPAVSVSKSGTTENPRFSFAFRNLKGNTGDKGSDGITPNITASAYVSPTLGTPSVSVTRTGTKENPNFAFYFDNLIGRTPQLDMYAYVQTGTGIPSVSVEKEGTLEKPKFSLTFKNINGRGTSFYTGTKRLSFGTNKAIKTSELEPGSVRRGDLIFQLSSQQGRTYWSAGEVESDVYSQEFQEGANTVVHSVVDIGMWSWSYPAEGATFTPSISDDGILSWTNNDDRSNPKPISVIGPVGPAGPTGNPALVYNGKYSGEFLNPTAAIILKCNDFNRIPEAGDRFVLFSTQSKYASCYVVDVDAESEDATCRFTDVVDTKGLPGAQGAQGEIGPTGNVALQFDGILEIGNPLKIEDFLQDGSYRFNASNYADNFNRTPVRGDSFLALAKYTYAPYNVFLVSAYIFAPTSASSYIKIAKYCDVSGQVGPRGADGANGVGFSTASVTATTTEEEYTTTTVTLTKTDSTTNTVEIKAKNAINPNTVSFIGTVTADMWQDSTTYSTYGYKYSALMPFTGGAYATDTYVPDIVPSVVSDIASGNFAPFANSLSTGVQVYAKSKPTATTNFNVSLSHVQ